MKIKHLKDPISLYFLGVFITSVGVFGFLQLKGAGSQPKANQVVVTSSRTETTQMPVAAPVKQVPGKLVVDKESNQKGTFKSIKRALLEAKNGDMIVVMPGTYEECINISKNVEKKE